MKRIFALVLLSLVLVSCTKKPEQKPDDTAEKVEVFSENESETVGYPEIGEVITFDVSYTYEDSRDPIKPSINLDFTSMRYSFVYSGFSSYIPMGSFEMTKDKLFLWTDEKKSEAYAFNVTDAGFAFDAASSPAIPTYKVSGDSEERYSPVPNGALFKLHTNNTASKEYGVTEYGGYVKRFDSDEKMKMSEEDADAVSNIVFGIEWKEGGTDCVFDAQIDINGFLLKYHSSCGSLNHITPVYYSHSRSAPYSFVLGEEERAALNSILESYIELGDDIVDK